MNKSNTYYKQCTQTLCNKIKKKYSSLHAVFFRRQAHIMCSATQNLKLVFSFYTPPNEICIYSSIWIRGFTYVLLVA
jgi:hypothetical protein